MTEKAKNFWAKVKIWVINICTLGINHLVPWLKAQFEAYVEAKKAKILEKLEDKRKEIEAKIKKLSDNGSN